MTRQRSELDIRAPPKKKRIASPTDPTAQLKRLMSEVRSFRRSKNNKSSWKGDVCLVKGVLEMFACL